MRLVSFVMSDKMTTAGIVNLDDSVSDADAYMAAVGNGFDLDVQTYTDGVVNPHEIDTTIHNLVELRTYLSSLENSQ